MKNKALIFILVAALVLVSSYAASIESFKNPDFDREYIPSNESDKTFIKSTIMIHFSQNYSNLTIQELQTNGEYWFATLNTSTEELEIVIAQSNQFTILDIDLHNESVDLPVEPVVEEQPETKSLWERIILFMKELFIFS